MAKLLVVVEMYRMSPHNWLSQYNHLVQEQLQYKFRGKNSNERSISQWKIVIFPIYGYTCINSSSQHSLVAGTC